MWQMMISPEKPWFLDRSVETASVSLIQHTDTQSYRDSLNIETIQRHNTKNGKLN